MIHISIYIKVHLSVTKWLHLLSQRKQKKVEYSGPVVSVVTL